MPSNNPALAAGPGKLPASSSSPSFDWARLEELAVFHEKEAYAGAHENLEDRWKREVKEGRRRLFTPEGKLRRDVFENFRQGHLFTTDLAPYTDFSFFQPARWLRRLSQNPVRGSLEFAKQWISGFHRGIRKSLIEYIDIVEKEGGMDIARRLDIRETAGNPFWFKRKGAYYNMRWAKHLFYHALLRKYLGEEIKNTPGFVNLDLGASYGVFPYAFKKEYPDSRHVLVDFPDFLLLSYYFLAKSYPGAKIATYLDYKDRPNLDREFIRRFDFVLVPVSRFGMIAPGAVDMVSNFSSLGEMSREWFRTYLESDLFKKTKYFFTSNRFVSGPHFERTFNTDLTVRDYPLDDFETLYFDVNPLNTHVYVHQWRFFYQKRMLSSYYFDFVGRRA